MRSRLFLLVTVAAGPLGAEDDVVFYPLPQLRIGYGQYFGLASYRERTSEFGGVRSRYHAPIAVGELDFRLEIPPFNFGPYFRLGWSRTRSDEETFATPMEIQNNDLRITGVGFDLGLAIHHPVNPAIDLTTFVGISYGEEEFRRSDFFENGMPDPGGSVRETFELIGAQIGEEARIHLTEWIGIDLAADATFYAARVENSATVFVKSVETQAFRIRGRAELAFRLQGVEIALGSRYGYLRLEEETEIELPEIVVLPTNEKEWFVHGLRITFFF